MDETNKAIENDENDEEFSSYVTEYLNSRSETKSAPKSKNNTRMGTLVLILFLLAFAVAGIIFAFYALSPQKKETMDLPQIKVRCTSPTTNTAHDITAKFTLTARSETLNRVGKDSITEDIQTAIANMDYDNIPNENDTEYIKNYVKVYLEKKYPGIDISEIYIRNYATDTAATMHEQSDSDSTRTKQDAVINGISSGF
jgi:hypothetical protein